MLFIQRLCVFKTLWRCINSIIIIIIFVYYYYFFVPSVSRIPMDLGKKIDTNKKIVGVTITPTSPPEQKIRAAERYYYYYYHYHYYYY